MSITKLGESQQLTGREVPFCPTCNHQLDGFGGVNHDEKPRPGDYTVCIGCCEMLVFSKALTLRKPSIFEIDDMDPEQLETISDTVKMLRSFKRHQADQENVNNEPDLMKRVDCPGVGDNDGFFELGGSDGNEKC